MTDDPYHMSQFEYSRTKILAQVTKDMNDALDKWRENNPGKSFLHTNKEWLKKQPMYLWGENLFIDVGNNQTLMLAVYDNDNIMFNKSLEHLHSIVVEICKEMNIDPPEILHKKETTNDDPA